MLRRTPALLVVVAVIAVAAAEVGIRSQAIASLTTPRQYFGADVGDDYFLATYTQLEGYWRILARESDRVQLVDIGRTTEGRPQLMAIVSAPENLARLDRYREISGRLARAEGMTDDEARRLAAEGRAVVWIDGGLHATEVLGAQQLIELVYRLARGSDDETARILRDVIVLVAHANPDGHELVSQWYMRHADPARRSLGGVPRAYHKYVGHDNNRDFFLSSQAETTNVNRVLYHEWFPQIVYDHHQAGPPGTVMFAPPFRDPFNYVFDPLMIPSIDLVGAAMHARFAAEGKRGVTMRGGSTYSTWWNGGLRTTAYFHNQIGLLTETIGSPTPMLIPSIPSRQVPSGDLPLPIAPQRWRFRQSIDYSMTANYAVLDAASRHRETLLANAYRMGRNSIERGSRDTWTPRPLDRDGGVRGTGPAGRDARAYLLPADQPDFQTATRFVEALLKNGVTVHRATRSFDAGGRTYPAGTYVVKTAQAFRPHVLDMFEPQWYPDDVPYPGGPPIPPYDIAGWTLAFQMGVKFDRVLDGIDGPFEVVTRAAIPEGGVVNREGARGFLFAHRQNDAFAAVNRLLAAGAAVWWPSDRTVGGAPGGTGAMYVEPGPAGIAVLTALARERGITFTGVRTRPAGASLRLRPVRIALWDRYGGSSPSGWTRWILEQFEFPYEVVYAPAIDAGRLAERFDVLILTDEAEIGADSADIADDVRAADVPEEYRHMRGVLTAERSVPQLRAFAEAGGTLIAVGHSASIGEALGLVRVQPGGHDGGRRPLGENQFYVPGSILRVSVDNQVPAGYGFEPEADVFFDSSLVLRPADGPAGGARRAAWFAGASPLRSGWAWGERHLEGGLAAVDAPLGRGRVYLFAPEVAFRAQSQGTFKFLFNAIFAGPALSAPPATR